MFTRLGRASEGGVVSVSASETMIGEGRESFAHVLGVLDTKARALAGR